MVIRQQFHNKHHILLGSTDGSKHPWMSTKGITNQVWLILTNLKGARHGFQEN